jgi:2-hydroxy fatty acid dioxygenase
MVAFANKNTMSKVSYLLAHVFASVVLTVVVRAAWGFENAEKALAFYGVYHRDPRNQLVHFFGVPGILWSLVVFMTHLPFPYFGKFWDVHVPADYSLTYGLVLMMVYLIFYLWIDPLGAIMYAPFLYAMYISSVYMRRSDQKQTVVVETAGTKVSSSSTSSQWFGTGRLLRLALIVHVYSWYIQIHLGHQVFEGAQPAVMQSLGGALTVAPLFAFYEGLWLVGINKDLQQETLQLVDKYTIDLCSTGLDMRVCKMLGIQTTVGSGM